MGDDKYIKLILRFGQNEIVIAKDSVFRLMEDGLQGVESAAYLVGTEQSAVIDGSYVVSEKFDARAITITLGIEDKKNTEAYRRLLLRYLNPTETGTLIVERSGVSRMIGVKVNGNITFSQPNIKQDFLHATINLICPDPWFYDTDETVKEFKQAVPLLTFPFNSLKNVGITSGVYYRSELTTVNNTGDTDIGVVIEVEAMGAVSNPMAVLLNGLGTGVGTIVNMSTGDKLAISTIPRQKSIKLNGESVFLFERSSVFFQLPRGETTIQVTATAGANNMINSIRYRLKYLGV